MLVQNLIAQSTVIKIVRYNIKNYYIDGCKIKILLATD